MTANSIITIGCSFTSTYDLAEPAEYCHLKWPDILADKLGIAKYKNLAKSGAGSDYIYHTLYKQLIEGQRHKRLKCVIVAWPSANRQDQKLVRGGNWSNRWMGRILHHDMTAFVRHDWINDTLVDMWSTYLLCKSYNIPYVGFQMGPFYGAFSGENDPEHIHEAMHLLNEFNVPLLEDLPIYKQLIKSKHLLNDPAFCLYDELDLYKHRYTDDKGQELFYRDAHFDEDGHKLISEWLYDKIQRLGY